VIIQGEDEGPEPQMPRLFQEEIMKVFRPAAIVDNEMIKLKFRRINQEMQARSIKQEYANYQVPDYDSIG